MAIRYTTLVRNFGKQLSMIHVWDIEENGKNSQQLRKLLNIKYNSLKYAHNAISH